MQNNTANQPTKQTECKKQGETKPNNINTNAWQTKPNKQYKYKYMANQAEQTNCIKQSKPNKNTAKNMANQAKQTKLTKKLRSRGR